MSDRLELFIFITNDCNLGCSYCSVLSNQSNKFPLLPNYSINDLIEFIINSSEKLKKNNIDIYFFGGEPTLSTKFIENIIISTNKLKKLRFRYILHTNGLLIHNINDLILNHLNGIILSINYEKIPTKNLKESYFGNIINNVRQIKERKKISIMARLTITENVSLYHNVVQVYNFFDFIYWQIQNCTSFHDYKVFYNNYKYELNLLWEYWYSFVERGVILNFIPFIAPFTLKKEILNSSSKEYLCGYGNYMVYIQTNGNCYSCAEEILDSDYFKIGDIFSGFVFRSNKTLNVIERCSKCQFYKFCKGRCGRMQERFSQYHIEEYCLLNSELFGLINKNYSKIIENNAFNSHLNKLNPLMLEMTEYVP